MTHHRGRAAAVLGAIGLASVGLPVPGAAQPNGEVPQARRVAQLTGAGSINETDVRYQVNGTDLGIMWTNKRGLIRIAFGDTFGVDGVGSGPPSGSPSQLDWRSNTLARSSDQDPADGLSFDDFVTDRPGHAKELLPSLKQDHVEMTKIPTGGVNVAGRDYLAYMSVRHFAPRGGEWTTNYSGIAYSDDNGQTWVDVPSARRPNSADFSDHFQMIAYGRRDGFVYLFGTPNGRFGPAYVARVSEKEPLEKSAYEYWSGSDWKLGDSGFATPIVPAPVGELSIHYNEALHRWMMMYLDESRAAIVIRSASEPTGPWTPETEVATAEKYPSLYGGFFHPVTNGTDIYFTMTQFNQYNVALMQAQLPHDALLPAPPAVRPGGR